MKIIKKLIKYVAILFGIIIIALIVIPVLFKDEIVAKVKEIANESVDATVDFGDFDLSLISSFPDFSFEINDVSVINKAPFEGDTLAHLGNLSIELDLMSVIGGEYVVSSFNLSDVTANAKILKDGSANWDIAIEDSSAVEEVEEVSEEVSEEAEEAGDFITGLESFSISNVNVSFVDLQSEMVTIIKGFNQSGSVIMVNDSAQIDIKTGIESFLFDLEVERLANNLKFESNIQLAADLNNMGFLFHKNLIKLNELKLGIDGYVAMPDNMNFDLTLSAKDNKFKDVLSLVPASYLTDLEGVETAGDFSLVAHLKGEMTDENLPGFDVEFNINDASFHYPNLPESVKNINMDLAVDNKDGIIDHTVIDLSLFHMDIAGNPIDLKFYMTNVESTQDMKAEVKSKFQLEKLAKAIPMEEGEEYKGGINADFAFAGKLSDIEKEVYDNFKADGSIIFDNLLYKSADLPTTLIKTGYLNFSPHYFEVSNFDLRLGKSDLTANGRVDNILPYVFHDSTIVGQFSINSNYFNLDELMEEDSTEVEESVEDEVTAALEGAEASADSSYEEPMEVIEIPKNVDFVLNSSFKKIDMEGMPIDDFKGEIKLKDGIAHFHEASMKVYDGIIKIDGEYNTSNLAHPSTSLDLSIDEMEIKQAYAAFNTVQQMVPIAEKAQGQFHTDLKFTTDLDDTLGPIYETMNGKGFLSTTNLGFAETEMWKKTMDVLKVKQEKFDKIRAEDIKIYYRFVNGKLETDPFKLNMGTIKGEVSGYTTFDNKIDYKYALQIPREELGSAANNAASFAEGLAGKNGIDLSLGEYVNVNVLVTGSMDEPKYKVVPAGTSGEKSMKDQAKEAITEKIDQAKEKAKEELDKAKKKAEEEAARLKKEAEDKAKAEADRLKKEAEEKARAEAEKQKEKAKDEVKSKAKDLLKKKGLGF